MLASKFSLDVSEERAPLWAVAAPLLYLGTCALGIHGAAAAHADVGVAGVLAALGLLPAFAVPGIFARRKARLDVTDDGLHVDHQFVKFDHIGLEPIERGQGRLTLMVRGGSKRSFVVASLRDARQIVALLPPVSAPNGALIV